MTDGRNQADRIATAERNPKPQSIRRDRRKRKLPNCCIYVPKWRKL